MKSYLSLKGPPTRAVRWCVVLTMIYVAFLFLLPAKQGIAESYNLSLNQYHLAILMFELPTIIVWFFAFVAYGSLHSFADTLNNTEDGKNFARLSTGITWLAWSLPLTAIADRLLSGISVAHSAFNSASVIISNYFSVVLALVSFLLIGAAARGIAGNQMQSLSSYRNKMAVVALMAFGVLYCFLILRTFNLASLSSPNNVYRLPVWLMVMSVVIPFLYAWFTGLLAAYELLLFSLKVPGLLYKKALRQIVLGLLFVVVSYIVAQYLDSVWQTPVHIIFSTQLATIALFRILGGVGFILIAFGSLKLKRIEQV